MSRTLKLIQQHMMMYFNKHNYYYFFIKELSILHFPHIYLSYRLKKNA